MSTIPQPSTPISPIPSTMTQVDQLIEQNPATDAELRRTLAELEGMGMIVSHVDPHGTRRYRTLRSAASCR